MSHPGRRAAVALPAVAFVIALVVTFALRHEGNDPAAAATGSRAQARPSAAMLLELKRIRLRPVAELPKPLKPAPRASKRRAPRRTPVDAATTAVPAFPQAAPTPAPPVLAPAPAPPAPVATAQPTPVPTFDDRGSGPQFDDSGTPP